MNTGSGEIQDTADPGVDQVIGGALGAFRRGGDDPDFDALGVDGGLEIARTGDFEAVHLFADLERIAVERAHDVEAASLEFGVMQQGAAKVADADERGAPFTVHAEGSLDGRDEADHVVPYAAHAEFAEVGEVLTDLRGVHVTGLGEGAGRDDFHAVALHAFEHLDVDGETTNSGSGDTFAFE